MKLYSVQGVQEYWIADRLTKRLEIYRRNKGQLVLVATLMQDDELTSPLLPNFHCSVQRLFGNLAD